MLPENAFYNGFMSMVCNEHNEIGDANGVWGFDSHQITI